MEKDYCVYKVVTMRRDVDNYKQVERYNRHQAYKMIAIVFGLWLLIVSLMIVAIAISVNC